MTAIAAAAPPAVSTRKALTFVYLGYAFRYLYLLILVPFYGRVLGAAEYGRVLAAMSVYQFVWALAEYGFPQVGLRDVALDASPARAAEVYGRHAAGRLWTTSVGVAVGIAATAASPVLRERPLYGVFATLSGIVAAYNLGWFFQGTLRFRTSVMVEFFGFTLNLILVLLLVHSRNDGWIVLAALLASSTIATATAHGVALRMVDRPSLRWDGTLNLVRESTALFAARGLALVTASSSTFLISILADAKQVGWYGAADRLATAGLSLMLPANQVMIGTVAALIASERTEQAAFDLIRRGLVALVGLGTVMLVGTAVVAGIAVPVILGPDFGPSVRMLRLLGLLFPFAAFSQVITGYVFIPLRRDRMVTVVSFVGALVTVVFTVALGHSFRGDGVACARTLGYVATSAALAYLLRREGLVGRLLGLPTKKRRP